MHASITRVFNNEIVANSRRDSLSATTSLRDPRTDLFLLASGEPESTLRSFLPVLLKKRPAHDSDNRVSVRAQQNVSQLMRDDIAKLWQLRDDRYAVMVVKHEHVPRETVKFLGEAQTMYEKKNWSSVMLMNCAKCRALTPEFVNSASGLELHQFKWLAGDDLIGALPAKWNHLVGYDPPDTQASLIHFTIGGPYFPEYRDCEYSREWFAEQDAMLKVVQRQKAAVA